MTFPIISPTIGYAEIPNYKYMRLYNNVFFDYFSEQMPRNHKEMFKWCELVFYSTPVLVNGIRKLVNYPVTDFIYLSESEKIKEDTRRLLEEQLNMKAHLLTMGLDYYIYGNVFRSVYYPFTRFLTCSVCSDKVNIKYADYTVKRAQFILNCPKCRSKRGATIHDDYADSPDNLKLISWDPYSIDLSFNSITGDTAYYCNMSKTVANGILIGDPVFVESLPSIFFDSFKKVQTVKFSDNFYHMKFPTITGFASGWGVSPLMPALKPFMYMAILRKGREAIGLEQITPKNILYPQGNSSTDPTITSSMARWKAEMSKAIEAWRRDPNYTMLAPYPTGVVNIGSQGKHLLPIPEIQAAEEECLRALDIPVEFVYGTTTMANSTVMLRVLENQLLPYVAQQTGFVNWVIDQINTKYGKNYCHVKFVPFKLADDIQQKELVARLMGSGGVSTATVLETLGLRPHEEREKMKNEQIENMKMQRDIEMQQQKMQGNIAMQAQSEAAAANSDQIPAYNQQKIYGKGEEIAMQMMSIPYEERRSMLAKLKAEDFVMYSVVSAILRSKNIKMDQEG